MQEPVPFAVDTWRHIAGVYDSSTIKLYINGQLQASQEVETRAIHYPDQGEFVMGAFKAHGEFYPFAGHICEVRLWNRARSEADIQQTRHLRLDATTQTGLVGYWPLSDGSGQQVADWSRPGTSVSIEGNRFAWVQDEVLSLGGYSPAPPAPEGLTAASMQEDRFVARWQAVEEAEHYELDVSPDHAFTTFVSGFENRQVEGTEQDVTELVEETTYYYRVRAASEAGTSDSSEAASATTLERAVPTDNCLLDLSEVTAYVQLGTVEQVKTLVTQALSVETWVKPSESQTWAGFIGVMEDTVAHQGWLLGISNHHYCFALSTQGIMENVGESQLTYLKAPEAYDVDRWYHVAGVYTGTEMRLYVDGELVDTSEEQSGAIHYPTLDLHYPDQGQWVIGALKDRDESYTFRGRLTE
ncbi:hypothetical protein C2W62_38560 [Candidatus Entotheonella serta]|nr:hypothetical protein C2W62_38560 [Candidatus Entotheonella serta]